MTAPDRTDRRQPVARLLGPEGPELTCEQCFDQLDHYLTRLQAQRRTDDR